MNPQQNEIEIEIKIKKLPILFGFTNSTLQKYASLLLLASIGKDDSAI